MNTTPATITEATTHYGFKIVFVENYAAVDATTGVPCIVTEWYENGCLISAEGFKVRKDGTPYARKCSLRVTAPDNVRAALASITD